LDCPRQCFEKWERGRSVRCGRKLPVCSCGGKPRSSLGREVDVELFEVFMGLISEWDVPSILEHHRLIDELEADDILERMSDANAEAVLSGYVKRAYFDYRKATKFLH
jgi:hypothetical protein